MEKSPTSYIKPNTVLLLKATSSEDSTEDKYVELLKENGYEVLQVKTLSFEYKSLEQYKDCLNTPGLFSGLIFSSPRCVIATKLALSEDKLDVAWKTKDNYVVGEATHKAALEELALNCLGKETGNANNLSEVMLKEKLKYKNPFLYPHGNLKMDILKNNFQSEIKLHEICVYDTSSNESLDEEIKIQTNNNEYIPEFLIFFSPSGLKSAQNYLQTLPINELKIIAIGPTTEAALLENGMTIFGVARRPTPMDLLNVIKQ